MRFTLQAGNVIGSRTGDEVFREKELSIMKREALLLYCLLSILVLPQAAQGQEGKKNGSFSLYWENDFLAKTDCNYTNGVKLTWMSPWLSWKPDGESDPPGHTPWYHSVIKALPFVYSPRHQASMFFLAGGQNIYTPDDTDRQDLIVDDRPYAGYLYLGIGFMMKGDGHMDTLEVDAGIVGRHSYAQDVQEQVHKWIGEDSPKGWANQLKDEPTLEINYERKWKWLKVETGDHWGSDVIPHLGGSVGNVAIYANAGAEFRFGWNRPDTTGAAPYARDARAARFPTRTPTVPRTGASAYFSLPASTDGSSCVTSSLTEIRSGTATALKKSPSSPIFRWAWALPRPP